MKCLFLAALIPLCERTEAAAPAWFTAMKDNTWKVVAYAGAHTILGVSPNPALFPNAQGAEGVYAVCNDWTGGCANQTTGEYILPAQGGHNGYYGNEIYALALRDSVPAWKRIWGPTPDALIKTDDLPCSHPGYSGYADGAPRATHGWFSQFCSNDGRIWSTMQDANPSGCWTTEVYSIDRGNLAAGWTFHGRLWPSIPPSFGYQAGPGIYDPEGDRIWHGADFASQNGLASIDVAQAVAAGPQSHTGPQVPGSKIYDFNGLSCAWSVVTSGLSPRCWIIGAVEKNNLWIMDLENSPGTFIQKSTSGSPNGWTCGAGAIYHKQSRTILVGEAAYGAHIRRLSISGTNPLTASYTWSELPLDPANTIVPPNPSQMQGTYSKFQIIEDMGNGQSAVCVAISVNLPTFVYKLPGVMASVEKSSLAHSGAPLTISPNPVTGGRAFIRTPQGVRSAIYDLRGRRLANFAGGEFFWDAGEVSPGVYCVRGKIGNREISKRFLVQ